MCKRCQKYIFIGLKKRKKDKEDAKRRKKTQQDAQRGKYTQNDATTCKTMQNDAKRCKTSQNIQQHYHHKTTQYKTIHILVYRTPNHADSEFELEFEIREAPYWFWP